jgi:hypothetical protein
MKNKEYCLNGSTRKYSGISGFVLGLPIFEININNPILKVTIQHINNIKLTFIISVILFSLLFEFRIKPKIGINEGNL